MSLWWTKSPFQLCIVNLKLKLLHRPIWAKVNITRDQWDLQQKKTNDLKRRKTRVNMSSLAVFLVCPSSKNVLNTSTLKWVFDPKSLSSCMKLDRWCELSSLIQHSCPGKAVLFRFFYFMFQTQGSVTLENTLIRVELVRGGLVRSLVHKASGR